MQPLLSAFLTSCLIAKSPIPPSLTRQAAARETPKSDEKAHLFQKNPFEILGIGLYNSPQRRFMAGDQQITCSDCGQDFTFTAADQTFFQERGYSTPKRCKPCRQAKKNDQGGSGYRSAPSQGTPVICSGCGQPTTVPFEPRGDRPVYCRGCDAARKGSGGGASRGRDR
jgi:CxxC-x17-CxxC domain-containing protein